MSIRLIVEVLDHWKDFGLTAGERGDLIIVAENANDQTRETFGPMHEEYILERAGKSAAGWKNVLGKLMRKKALEYAVHNGREMSGFPGQHAVYRIPVLCPEPPHDGLRGQCTRPERVTSQMTQSETRGGTGHLSDDPIQETGHLSDANGSPDRWERVTSQVTPTPLSPQPPHLSLAEQVVRDSGVVAEDERETFISWLKDKHQIRGPGWWKTVTHADLVEHAADWRAQQQEPSRTKLAPACAPCLERNPHAERNVRWRTRDGQPCPDCHPSAADAA